MFYTTKTKSARLKNRCKSGTPDLELLPVKTEKHFYMILRDVKTQRDIFAASTLTIVKDGVKDIKSYSASGVDYVSKKIAEFVKTNNLTEKHIFFNRSSYKYHGKIAAAYEGFLKQIKN